MDQLLKEVVGLYVARSRRRAARRPHYRRRLHLPLRQSLFLSLQPQMREQTSASGR